MWNPIVIHLWIHKLLAEAIIHWHPFIIQIIAFWAWPVECLVSLWVVSWIRFDELVNA
jgi:hypothetical protein